MILRKRRFPAACAWVLAGALAGPMANLAAAQDETVVIGGLEWARSTSGEDLRWPDAVEYCAGLELGGHGDWRLPTLEELESVHDPQAENSIGEAFSVDTCCLWSGDSLVDRPAADGDEIGGTPGMYHWGLILDGGLPYYAVHIYPDGQALCVRHRQGPAGYQ